MQTAPFEIMAAPYTVWVAPVATAFPDLSAAPSGTWVKLGAVGDENYDEDGVTVSHEQTIEEFRPVGSTGARKAFRTEESLVISFNLADVTPAMYGKVLNNATVTDTAAGVGTAGNLNLNLYQGLHVARYALLARAEQSAMATADSDAFRTQYEVPIVYQNASPEVVHKKGEPAMLACEFRALKDPTLGFGKLRSQDAAAS